MIKSRLLIVQRIFPDYRQAIFNRLNKNYNLRLVHSENKSGINQVNKRYSIKLKSYNYGNKDTSIYFNIWPILRKFKPNIIIHELNPSILSLFICLFYAKVYRKKIILWGHGFNQKKGFDPKKSIKSKIRLFTMKKADAILTYGLKGKHILSDYINKQKIFVAQNTLDTNKLLRLKTDFEKIGVEYLKKELNVSHQYNLIFIGRLLPEKHPEYLIEIFEKLRFDFKNNLGIHYIGTGIMKSFIEDYVQRKGLEKFIHLHGQINDDLLSSKYLFIADLMVMPGYLGLSVNHSFCFSTPVVSFLQNKNGPFHSPEVEYVIQKKTGYLAKNGDVSDIIDFIKNYLENKSLQLKMRGEIKNLISTTASIENMEWGFNEAVKYVLNTNKR